MQRSLIANVGGTTFFEKLRNGFNAVQKEVEKVEQLTSGVVSGLSKGCDEGDKQAKSASALPFETSYFQADIALLGDMYPVYVREFASILFTLNTSKS